MLAGGVEDVGGEGRTVPPLFWLGSRIVVAVLEAEGWGWLEPPPDPDVMLPGPPVMLLIMVPPEEAVGLPETMPLLPPPSTGPGPPLMVVWPGAGLPLDWPPAPPLVGGVYDGFAMVGIIVLDEACSLVEAYVCWPPPGELCSPPPAAELWPGEEPPLLEAGWPPL